MIGTSIKVTNSYPSRNHLNQKKLMLLRNVKPDFDDFMTEFQKEESVIDLLYPSTEKFLKTLMARLLKTDAYTGKDGRALKDFDKEDVNLQLSTKKFKEMQDKLHCKLQAFTQNKYIICNAFSNLA